MTLLLRQADVTSGKARPAFQWARELADYISQECPALQTRAFYEIYGRSGRVYWLTESDSVGAIDGEMERLARDGGYRERLQASLSQELFQPGSIQDVLLREA